MLAAAAETDWPGRLLGLTGLGWEEEEESESLPELPEPEPEPEELSERLTAPWVRAGQVGQGTAVLGRFQF